MKARDKLRRRVPIQNLFIRGVITFSADGIANIKPQELDAYAETAIKQISEELGVRPLYYARHDDETTRHYHFLTEAVNRETGKSAGNRLYRKICRKLQDITGAVFAPLGLRRGEQKEVTNATYKTVLQAHREAVNQSEAEYQQVETATMRLIEETEQKREQLEQQLQTIRQKIEEAKPTIERIDREEQRRAEQRDKLTRILRRLNRAGVKMAHISERTEQGWRELPEPLNLAEVKNWRGLAEDMLRRPGERHIKLYGHPPVFCLDDIAASDIAKIRQEYGTLAEVETSPDNYQVWVAFDAPRPLKLQEWRTVNDYLVNRYGADRAANRAGHYYRLPSFRRVDADWISKLTDTPPKRAKNAQMQDIIKEHTPHMQQQETARKELTERMGCELKAVEAPDWFKEKWARNWDKASGRTHGDHSLTDWNCALYILTHEKDKAKRLESAAWIADILTVSAQERAEKAGKKRKSREYGEYTAYKAYRAAEESFDR